MSAPHTIASAAVVPLVATFGGKLGAYVSTVTPGLPEWVAPLLGPAGALIGTLLAIRWLLARLGKVESKIEKRDEEFNKNLTAITTIAVQNQQIIEQNSETLSDVKEIIKNCSAFQHRQ